MAGSGHRWLHPALQMVAQALLRKERDWMLALNHVGGPSTPHVVVTTAMAMVASRGWRRCGSIQLDSRLMPDVVLVAIDAIGTNGWLDVAKLAL